MAPNTLAIRELPNLPLFNMETTALVRSERGKLSYQRAAAIAQAYNLTRDDVKYLTPHYWNLNADPIMTLDTGATTLVTIQLNLCAGTILHFARDDRQDLLKIVDDLLVYKLIGQFMLTEVDHGLDAINLETTCTMLQNGEGFILNTPHPGAAKFMPPTVPAGIPAVAIVYARLLANGKDLGVKPFLVDLNDGHKMSPGVSARLMPPRGGLNPVPHSITTFNNVHIPAGALLVPSDWSEIEAGTSSQAVRRLEFLDAIWRVAVGSLSLAAVPMSSLSLTSYISTRYSQRRTITSGGLKRPLIYFRTQHAPIIRALSRQAVLKVFMLRVTTLFSDTSIDHRIRHGLAAVMKVLAVHHAQEANLEISERCGAQGLHEYNGIINIYNCVRGIAIAEGDLLGISIRLASELLLKRYALPSSFDAQSPLALHEVGMMTRLRGIMSGMSHHRDDSFNNLVVPESQPLVLTIGLRMAYETAVAAKLDPAILDVYLTSAMQYNAVWYSENLGLKQEELSTKTNNALDAALPRLDEWLEATGVEPYVKAPIVSLERWNSFVDGLSMYGNSTSSSNKGLSKEAIEVASARL